MEKLQLKEIREAMQGTLLYGNEDGYINDICHDSRLAYEDSIFFAVVGESTDGHRYLKETIEKGCKNLVISTTDFMDNIDKKNLNIIKVDNTKKALGDLAKYYLCKFKIRTIGITGSTGKTSTKDLTYNVFKNSYRTDRTKGNFNNDIGLPLTVFSFTKETQVGILEMGMDHVGEIEYLVNIGNPEIGIITNIGTSHIENLGSREAIFNAKMEITSRFAKENTLIVSQGEDFLQRENLKGDYKIVITGLGEDSDIRIENICDLGENGIKFTLCRGDEHQEFNIPVMGVHNAFNAALAVAAGIEFGITMKEAAEGLKKAQLTGGRQGIFNYGNIKVIDDTYNASPDSMKAAIKTLMGIEGKRKIAILGDMLELGNLSKDFHREIGLFAKKSGVDKVLTIGTFGEQIKIGAENKGVHFKNKEDLIEAVKEECQEGDVFLVKGSRGMCMEEIIEKVWR